MNEKPSQFDQAFSAMSQVDVPWYWDIDWLSKQHASVPPAMLVKGVIELGFTPRQVINGIAYFDGDQYGKLQSWLLEKTREALQEKRVDA